MSYAVVIWVTTVCCLEVVIKVSKGHKPPSSKILVLANVTDLHIPDNQNMKLHPT